MTTQGAAGVEQFRSTIARLDAQKTAFADTVSLKVVPALTLLAKSFEKSDSSGKAWGETVGNVLNRTLADFLLLVQQSGPAWSSLMKGLLGNKQAAQDAALGLSAMREAMKNYRGEVDMMTEGGLPTAFNQIAKAAAPATESLAQMRERLAAIRAELQALVGSSTGDVAEKMLAIEAAFKKGVIDRRDETLMSAQVTKEAIALQKAALMDLIATPTEDFTTKIAAINAAYNVGTINATEWGKVTRQVNKENVNNWADLAGAAGNAISQIFGQTKAGAIAAAILNTAQGVTKALADGGFFGFAKAALVAAAGLAQIAKIKSTNLSSSGGSGGGGGGVSAPSVPAAAAAAGDQPAQAGPPSQTLTVNPIGMGDLFTGDAVRQLAERLLDYQRNGGTVLLMPRT